MAAQGPCESLLGEAVVDTMEGACASAEPPTSELWSPAPIPPPVDLRDGQQAVVSAADCYNHQNARSEVVQLAERCSSRVRHKRARDGDVDCCPDSSSFAASASAPTDAAAAEEQLSLIHI